MIKKILVIDSASLLDGEVAALQKVYSPNVDITKMNPLEALRSLKEKEVTNKRFDLFIVSGQILVHEIEPEILLQKLGKNDAKIAAMTSNVHYRKTLESNPYVTFCFEKGGLEHLYHDRNIDQLKEKLLGLLGSD